MGATIGTLFGAAIAMGVVVVFWALVIKALFLLFKKP